MFIGRDKKQVTALSKFNDDYVRFLAFSSLGDNPLSHHLLSITYPVLIKVSSLTSYSLTIDEEEVPVVTDLWFSKLGKVYQLASVVVGGQNISEIGKTIPEAVQNLAEKIQNEKVNCILV